MVEEFEAGSQEVGFNVADEVLAVHGEVVALARYREITVFGHPLSEQLTVIRSNKGAIRLLDRFRTFSFVREGLALLNKSIIVRIITEYTLLRPLPQNLRQVMHVIGEHVGLEFVGGDLLGSSNQQLQIDFLGLFLRKYLLVDQMPVLERIF